jgi:hypothetical protein
MVAVAVRHIPAAGADNIVPFFYLQIFYFHL